MSFKSLISRIQRVLLVSSKPDKDEFKQSSKITALGFAVLGVIGFAIFILTHIITGGTGL